MIILSKQNKNRISLYTFTATTLLFINYTHTGLCTTANENKIVSSTLFRKETSWTQKRKRLHQTREVVSGKVTQQPTVLTKTLENKVQKMESKDKDEAVTEE